MAAVLAIIISILPITSKDAYAAVGKVVSVSVANLTANQLTLRKGSTFTIRPKVTVTVGMPVTSVRLRIYGY